MPTPEELRQTLIRNFHDAPLERFERPPLYDTRSTSLTEGTAAAKLGASFDIVPPGKQSCPYHFHYAQEEMFVILQGEGTLRVAGELVPIKAGDVITTPAGPGYPHQILNTSDAPLHYLSISTKERPEVCEYPDSGKVGVFASGLRFLQKREAGLDYWDGEP
ncbi:cupin domain-containing protein [Roseateles saccharophilus]|uniref:Putative cupin superfamily protein n=1 Tax=Roseateles saccharophilus TaxID=304 RepID=A0A4R3UJV4_ROSSA|nr:cupin domain-containing protein [Roseateles saccharophilus]MDG0834592.1 cupin domain-containing protein [Roseateles saccharophilus]TCU89049.1 putative cupin superfamily protein [Roseateles saccharophilus]